MVHCLDVGNKHASREHQTMLTDCAAICGITHDFLHRGSPHAEHLCVECAEICNACSAACSRLAMGDEMMTECAKMCHDCATACKNLKPNGKPGLA